MEIAYAEDEASKTSETPARIGLGTRAMHGEYIFLYFPNIVGSRSPDIFLITVPALM